MRKRPQGARYRNLVCSAHGVIYYERVVGGTRRRKSTRTRDWDLAAAVRDAVETKLALGEEIRGELSPPLPLTFAEATTRWFREDSGHLAETTKRDRRSALREDGPLMRSFARDRLDEISPEKLRRWWADEVDGKGWSHSTGRNHVNALAGVLAYAREVGLLGGGVPDAVAELRRALRRRARTKSGRSRSSPNARPIESPDDLLRLVAAAREERLQVLVAVLLLLDAGLRLGEAHGLTWDCVTWGADENDRTRSLWIQRTRSRGGAPAEPKAGRARRVTMSRRLRTALRQLYREAFEPAPRAQVLRRFDPAGFRRREWRRICSRAGIGQPALKDLRDTYASQLLTAGAPLGYISEQLGHSNAAVTAKHYARWAGGGEDREPLRRRQGEVWADLLARLGEEPDATARFDTEW